MLSIYKASAGSGKTYTLTGEYLRMLFRDYSLGENYQLKPHVHVLAVTFTKKATAEMKERILKALYLLSQDPTQSPYYEALSKEFKLDDKTLKERAQTLLYGILQDYSRFSVTTIDGFFQQVVRTFAMDLGLSTTYDLSLDNEEIIQQAVDDVFRKIRIKETDNKDIVSWITAFADQNIEENNKWNPYQNVSVFSTELNKEKLKRNLLQVREFFADKNNIRLYREQLEKVIAESVEKVNAILQTGKELTDGVEGLVKVAISVFSLSAEKFFEKGFNETTLQVVNQNKDIYTKSAKQKAVLEELFQHQLLPLYQKLIDAQHKERIDYYTAKAILPHLYSVGLIQDVSGQIEQTNKEMGRLPLADINMLIHQVIDGQEAPFIYERIGQHFRHFMIDEFQDTSALQWQNFEPLIYEAESNNHDNLIVGDVKQSIYRWRNSDWRLLNQVDKSFLETKLPKMDSNWRTAKLLVEHNEQLMLQYSQWVLQELQNKGWENHVDAQAISQIFAPEAIHQIARRDIPGIIHMQFFEGKKDEVNEQCIAAVLEQLKQLAEEHVDFSRVAVLVEKNKEAELLAKHLIANGYSVQSNEGMRVHSHPAVQLLVSIMQQAIEKEENTGNEVTNALIAELHAPFTEEEQKQIDKAMQLPLYECVQTLIGVLDLEKEDGALPYLTAFQDQIYHFSQSRIANTKLFLEYWNRKKQKASVPTPPMSNALRIMTVHSSKGLEFDIVMLPFFNWRMKKKINGQQPIYLWCQPQTSPYDQMPLVVVECKDSLEKTHLQNDYVQEIISQYIDSLNVTYVAITRPKYRLYTYGKRFVDIEHPATKIEYIGQLFSSFLYQTTEPDEFGVETPLLQQLEDGSWCYHREDPHPALAPEELQDECTREATFVSVPINNRLTLRSRAEDDFDEETPLATIDLGILMHEWLAAIVTWEDAQPALDRMIAMGRITPEQQYAMQSQLQQLRQLLELSGKQHWFESNVQVLNERDILCATGKIQRPDRVILNEQHATVIDYKFGKEHTKRYVEQLRDYITLFEHMGYTVEAYIVYVAQQKIEQIQ